MSDKQSRYSHVDVLESNDARAVVHWRYALAEVENYKGALVDPLTGWFDWADEYWTVYPNGTALRKKVLWTSVSDKEHEWQETIVINGPGVQAGGKHQLGCAHLREYEGRNGRLHLAAQARWNSCKPDGPQKVEGPPNPNIQFVNLRSAWKPFQIFPPLHSSFVIYGDENLILVLSAGTTGPWPRSPPAADPALPRTGLLTLPCRTLPGTCMQKRKAP